MKSPGEREKERERKVRHLRKKGCLEKVMIIVIVIVIDVEYRRIRQAGSKAVKEKKKLRSVKFFAGKKRDI